METPVSTGSANLASDLGSGENNNDRPAPVMRPATRWEDAMRTLTLAAAAMMLSAPAFAETLTILHTNDFHNRIEPINKYDSGCSAEDDAEGKCFGGSARLATAIRAARAATNNSLLVDGGDQFQGSLFYSYYKGKATAEMMIVSIRPPHLALSTCSRPKPPENIQNENTG